MLMREMRTGRSDRDLEGDTPMRGPHDVDSAGNCSVGRFRLSCAFCLEGTPGLGGDGRSACHVQSRSGLS